MFARSTTFFGNPDKIDAGINFVTSEAGPALSKTDGCRGLSLLVNRATGECIATSSWDSDATMAASEARLRPIRERGREVLGASVQVDEWEIVVMQRNHHGECCRVSWLEGDQESMIETFRASILPQLEQMSGFCSASLLVSRSSDLGCITTAWETRPAMEASREFAADLRARIAGEIGGRIVDVHEFDLAYAHLHVPEMA